MTANSGRRPAFPNQAPLPGGMDRTGLTVRQYYKAMALQGFLACSAGVTVTAEGIVVESGAIVSAASTLADVMVEEDEAHANGQ